MPPFEVNITDFTANYLILIESKRKRQSWRQPCLFQQQQIELLLKLFNAKTGKPDQACAQKNHGRGFRDCDWYTFI